MNQQRAMQKEYAKDTRGSQAVTHPSTNRAQRCLTSVIGRELVLSTWYGPCRSTNKKTQLLSFPQTQNDATLFYRPNFLFYSKHIFHLSLTHLATLFWPENSFKIRILDFMKSKYYKMYF